MNTTQKILDLIAARDAGADVQTEIDALVDALPAAPAEDTRDIDRAIARMG